MQSSRVCEEELRFGTKGPKPIAMSHWSHFMPPPEAFKHETTRCQQWRAGRGSRAKLMHHTVSI